MSARSCDPDAIEASLRSRTGPIAHTHRWDSCYVCDCCVIPYVLDVPPGGQCVHSESKVCIISCTVHLIESIRTLGLAERRSVSRAQGVTSKLYSVMSVCLHIGV